MASTATRETITVERICPRCERAQRLTVNALRYARFMGGDPIHLAMPETTPMERETLVEGTCPACIRKHFGPPKEVTDGLDT